MGEIINLPKTSLNLSELLPMQLTAFTETNVAMNPDAKLTVIEVVPWPETIVGAVPSIL